MPASYPRIPYGWADFKAIRLENRLYVDKTRFVHALEEERYAFFILSFGSDTPPLAALLGY